MFAIVGGGWFGCHLAAVFQERGIEFELFEARPKLFDGASGYNQNRLHLGFHYPRSAETRRQSRHGFLEFLKHYPALSDPVRDNIYAVSDESLIDFETYCGVMQSSGLSFVETAAAQYGLTAVEGALRCEERTVATNRSRDYFTAALAGRLHLNCRYDQREAHRTIINCTYQAWRPNGYALDYEPCATLLYESLAERDSLAITIMDGPFCSVYPYEGRLSTLYSVAHSRLERAASYEQATNRLKAIQADEIARLSATMEAGMQRYLPDFRDRYRFAGWHGAVRSCLRSKSDARTCHVERRGDTIHVMSGKIDSIFHAEREVLKCLNLY